MSVSSKKKKRARQAAQSPAQLATGTPAKASKLDPAVLKILTESEDAEVELIPIIEQYQDDFEVFRNSDGMSKVRCKATGHEMPARLVALQEFMKGPKFRKRECYATDFSKYEPDIVPHKDMKKHLYCRLTGNILPRDPKKVEAHINSARWKELHQERQEAEKERRLKEQAARDRKRKKAEAGSASKPPPSGKNSKAEKPEEGAKKAAKAKLGKKQKLKDSKDSKGEKGPKLKKPKLKAKASTKKSAKKPPEL
mmetsp:Transcript_56464/g.104547  ORF Transcript_56464/g.104547 Transcript_56464/m.104547 type:complete len:253 (-) Transcript_56464:148-906(-)